jgi:hypothetical protein
MAVYRYATKDLSINNAQAFISALSAADGRKHEKLRCSLCGYW